MLSWIFLLLLSACSAPPPSAAEPANNCDPESYFADVEPLLQRWNDARMLAEATSRIQLAGPVGELQALHREAQALEAPACAAQANALLADYMGATVESFLAFMADAGDLQMQRLITTAAEKEEAFSLALLDLRQLADPSLRDVRVTYSVSSPVLDEANIDYTDRLGRLQQITASLPWSTSLDLIVGTDFELSARGGRVHPQLTCSATVDGVEVVSDQSTEGKRDVSCLGTVSSSD